MARSKIYVGMEIGTSKVVVFVGEITSNGSIVILGKGESNSIGVKKGEITDEEALVTCVENALFQAQEKSDVKIESVLLSFTGGHIQSLNSSGYLRISENQGIITYKDLQDVKNAAQEVTIPQNNVIHHAIRRQYVIDGQERVTNPEGLSALNLQGDFHIIHGVRTRSLNTIRFVREYFNKEIEEFIFAPLASSSLLLTRQHKQHGALVIDIGAGTSDYVLYENNMISHSGCLPIGGDHITNDLAIYFRIPHAIAEQYKETQCSAWPLSPAPNTYRHPEEPSIHGEINLDDANEVIHLRVKEILEKIKTLVNQNGALDRIQTGVFLTGGTSLLHGIDQVAQEVFELPVHRTAAAHHTTIAPINDPRYATALGLIRYAQIRDREEMSSSRGIRDFAQKIKVLFKRANTLILG